MNTYRVINTLERRFGRGKLIMNSIVNKSCKIPPFKEYKLDYIIIFSDNIRNLVRIIQTLNNEIQF